VARHIAGLVQYLPDYGWAVVEDVAEADIVHTHAAEPAVDVDVYTNHGIHPIQERMADWQSLQNRTIFDSIKYAREVIAVADWTADNWRDLTGASPHIIPNGIDLGDWDGLQADGRWRSALGITDETPIILWGKVVLSDVCDPTPALELALRRPEVAVVMTASVSQLPQAPDNVYLVGRQQYEQMQHLIAECDIYLGTTKENHSVQVLEAMACGKPVLGYAWGGTVETITDGVHGRLVEPGDMDALETVLDDVLDNADTYGKAGRALVEDRYQLQDITERTARIYDMAYSAKQHEEKEGVICSIVIPVYNKAPFVGEAIQSALLQQHAPNYELIIVDDGSKDNSLAAIRKAIKDQSTAAIAVTVVKQQNSGVSEARNNGIRRARGRYICCLDADDRIHPHFLQRRSAALDADPGLGIAYSDMVTFGHTPGKGNWQGHIKASEYDFGLMKQRNFIPCCNLFRRKAWERAGGYRNINPSWEDYEFWLRLGKLGWYGQRVPGGLFFYRKLFQEGRDYEAKDHSLYLRALVNSLHRDIYPPMVSVVIPCYEHSQFLDTAIQSALQQTFPDLEVVVVDDGNKPEEAEEIANIVSFYELSDVRLVRLEENQGLAAARNAGIEAAKGKWIVPLDADDMLDKSFVETTMRTLRMDEGSFAYTDSYLWYPDDNKEILLEANDYDFTEMLKHISWSCTIMLAKSAWTLVGGYSEEMSKIGGWEDWDFAIALGEIGICGLHVAEPLFYYRQHSETQMRKTAYAVKPRLQETLRRRHAAVYRGERTMGCCGSSSNKTDPTIDQLQAAAAAMPESEDGQQIVRYTGRSSAPRHWSTPSGATYEFYRFRPLVAMPAIDAAYFQTKPDFEIVPA